MSNSSSSQDSSEKHQYVIDENNRLAMYGKKCKWTTSKIHREDPKDDTSKIIKIEIV